MWTEFRTQDLDSVLTHVCLFDRGEAISGSKDGGLEDIE